jgi:hypothetical protein
MIEQSEILRRRDMRDVFTFTIDPADAKDFDDALSFECLAVVENDGLSAERSVSEAVCQAKPVLSTTLAMPPTPSSPRSTGAVSIPSVCARADI